MKNFRRLSKLAITDKDFNECCKLNPINFIIGLNNLITSSLVYEVEWDSEKNAVTSVHTVGVAEVASIKLPTVEEVTAAVVDADNVVTTTVIPKLPNGMLLCDTGIMFNGKLIVEFDLVAAMAAAYTVNNDGKISVFRKTAEKDSKLPTGTYRLTVNNILSRPDQKLAAIIDRSQTLLILAGAYTTVAERATSPSFTNNYNREAQLTFESVLSDTYFNNEEPDILLTRLAELTNSYATDNFTRVRRDKELNENNTQRFRSTYDEQPYSTENYRPQYLPELNLFLKILTTADIEYDAKIFTVNLGSRMALRIPVTDVVRMQSNASNIIGGESRNHGRGWSY